MKNNTKTGFLVLLLIALSAGSVWALNLVRSARGREATLQDMLYISSGKALKRLSLGYSSLLADIYWTRVVQYFGSRVQQSTHFELVGPLLDITTDLDPQLIPSYEAGAIFLSQKVPFGAGDPDKAVALLEKGIRENPEHWRLYFNLGFVNYMDRRDYKAAQEAFERGSRVTGAPPYLKVLAARMAEKSNDPSTALALWQTVRDANHDVAVRDTASKHINSLLADAEIAELERRIQNYRREKLTSPATWDDLINGGFLKGVPVDPTGTPYKLLGGRVEVANPKDFPFLEERSQQR